MVYPNKKIKHESSLTPQAQLLCYPKICLFTLEQSKEEFGLMFY